MEYRYAILDDESCLIIGYCQEILGLDGKVFVDKGISYHKISLINFHFCDDFKQYINENKESFNRLVYICVLDKEMKFMAQIHFVVYDKIYYHNIGFPKSNIDIDLSGSILNIIEPEQLVIWDKWRLSFPVNKNEWVMYTEEGRRAWLQTVKEFHFCIKPEYKECLHDTYFLDGKNVIDYPSFFCAIGEAINGPGSYYGFDINSIIDCLRGGFGPKAPFKLVWIDAYVAEKSLDKEAWTREIEHRKEKDARLLDIPEFVEIGDRPLFQAIIENLEQEGIEVILE